MADPSRGRHRRRRISGLAVSAVLVAFSLALGASGALVWTLRDRNEAERVQARVRKELGARTSGISEDRLTVARSRLAEVRAQLDAIPVQAKQVADLQDQDLALVKAALEAGKAGNVRGYNDAVNQRNDLSPGYDAAVEKLRTDVNTVLVVLATLTNRTAP